MLLLGSWWFHVCTDRQIISCLYRQTDRQTVPSLNRVSAFLSLVAWQVTTCTLHYGYFRNLQIKVHIIASTAVDTVFLCFREHISVKNKTLVTKNNCAYNNELPVATTFFIECDNNQFYCMVIYGNVSGSSLYSLLLLYCECCSLYCLTEQNRTQKADALC
jgi:hypothetical protein